MPEPRTYRPRYRRTRTEKPPLILQPRDITILEAIWDSRFLTPSLLLRLFPPDGGRMAPADAGDAPEAPGRRSGTNLEKRLAKLFHHGYLDRIRTVWGTELVYALAQGGADLLRTHQPALPLADADWRVRNREVSQLFVSHTLMIARFRITLTEALHEVPGVVLDRFLPEARAPKARWRHGAEDAYVNPDAFFILRETDRPEGRQRAAFFLEADRSTMALKRLRQKYTYYAALRSDRVYRDKLELPGFRVLTVCKSEDRVRNLLALVADTPAIPADYRPMFVFTTEAAYAAHAGNLLAAIWRDAATPAQPQAIVSSPRPRL